MTPSYYEIELKNAAEIIIKDLRKETALPLVKRTEETQKNRISPVFMVVPGRIELPTPAFSVPCSTY